MTTRWHRGTRCSALALAAVLLALPAAAFAGDENGEKKKDDFKKFEEVAKDHKEVVGPMGESGFFPLYFNEKDDQLLCVVPKAMLQKNFLLASSIAGGPNFAGYMWGDVVVQWHEMGKKLVLIAPDLRYKDDGKSTVSDVIQRTYTDRIITAVPIVAKKGADPVIDLGDIFKDDFAGVARVYGGKMDASLSKWAKRKSFPKNVEVAVDAAIMRGGNMGGTRARVHYSIIELPTNNGYTPREADNRIGYFLTVLKDWTAGHDEDTIFKRYINRWDVRKAEPDRAVSDVDPDHQIVFYIEKTVPVKYRRYVREGILSWNKAFEKAGIRNAVRVEQQTDTVHAEKDPEDVRYSFFRWIVSGRAFAMGPSMANPLTGQLLDADIIFDDSMARAWEMQYARYSGVGFGWADDKELNAFFDQHPEWKFVPQEERLLPETASYSGVDMTMDPKVQEVISEKHGYCTYANGLAHEMAMTMAFLEATGQSMKSEEYVGQLIKEVAAHEVGHTLGLRHNFKASTLKSVADILATTDPNEPTCGSVMDYNPGMFHLEKENQGLFVTQTIGPYDEWAIAYGYSIPDGKEHKDEASLLKSITSQVAAHGHAYATDEDTTFFAPDPTVNRFDNGSDVLEYAKQRHELVRSLRKEIQTWAVDDGESYNKLRRAFDMLLGEYSRSATFAARYVGGQYVNRYHKNDPDAGPPIEIVPVEKQREALNFVIDTVFGEDDFQFDPELLNKLAAGRWGHWDTDSFDSELSYPIHDRIAGVQFGPLFRLVNPITLNRIYDAEVKVPADQDALTVPEVINRVTDAVWSEIGNPVNGEHTNRKPFVSSIRRNLQRQHLQMMLNIVLAEPGALMAPDISAVTCMKMRNLSDKIGSVLENDDGTRLDDFTRAHFDDAKSRIDRALEAEYSL